MSLLPGVHVGSEDGGDTFTKAVVIYPGPSAYSCLTALRGAPDAVGLIFEHGSGGGGAAVASSGNSSGGQSTYGALSFARVPTSF